MRHERAVLLHRRHQAVRAHAREAVAGDRVRADVFDPLLALLRGLFLIIDLRHRLARRRDALEVLAAEDRAHARASRGALARHDGGVAHEVLARRADDDHAALDLLLVAFVQRLLDGLLRLGHVHAPERRSVMETNGVILDLYPSRRLAAAAHDQRVEPRLFQVVPEVAAAVGGGRDPRQRREGRHVESVGARRARARDGSRRDDDDILRPEGILRAGEVVEEDLRRHGLAADVQFAVAVRPGILLSRARGEVQQQDLPHITAVVCHKNHLASNTQITLIKKDYIPIFRV